MVLPLLVSELLSTDERMHGSLGAKKYTYKLSLVVCMRMSQSWKVALAPETDIYKNLE
jgi:hypothetical protein